MSNTKNENPERKIKTGTWPMIKGVVDESGDKKENEQEEKLRKGDDSVSSEDQEEKES